MNGHLLTGLISAATALMATFQSLCIAQDGRRASPHVAAANVAAFVDTPE